MLSSFYNNEFISPSLFNSNLALKFHTQPQWTNTLYYQTHNSSDIFRTLVYLFLILWYILWLFAECKQFKDIYNSPGTPASCKQVKVIDNSPRTSAFCKQSKDIWKQSQDIGILQRVKGYPITIHPANSPVASDKAFLKYLTMYKHSQCLNL